MKTTGYSGTPLVKKLTLKPGFRVATVNAPKHYWSLLGELPEGVRKLDSVEPDVDFVHLFTDREERLAELLPVLREEIDRDGMIWVSWPKKASKVPTDVTGDVVRKHALPLGLVDVKVCAVDEVWSGLKLVIRKELR